MTVSYTAKVANAEKLGCFIKLLFRWRGSIYKLVWPDLFVFLFAFFTLSGLYRFVLEAPGRRTFEKIVLYCDKYGSLIPVSFVLGFYVSIVIRRWWEQYRAIPFVDTLAIWVNSHIRGEGEKERLLRRTLMRYTCLAVTQCFTLISPRVKKRFPTLDHLVEGGLLLENEKELIECIDANVKAGAKYPTHFIPFVWAASIVGRARAENKIKNDSVTKSIMDEINKIKDNCGLLISYDWISVPLVYTQVVTLAVYVYFFTCIMGRQWVDRSGSSKDGHIAGSVEILDLFFPILTVMQFFFYMGWLKVAESLLNPFGDDDDDFEINWVVDRNIQMSYLIVDEMHDNYPELVRDQFWDEVVPQALPHTVASEQYKEEAPVSSTAKVLSSQSQKELLPASVRSDLHIHEDNPSNSKSHCKASEGIDIPGSGSRIPRNRCSVGRDNTPSQVSGSFERKGSGSGKFSRIGTAIRRILSTTSRRGREGSMGGLEEMGRNDEMFGSLIDVPEESSGTEMDENVTFTLGSLPPERSGLREENPPKTSAESTTVTLEFPVPPDEDGDKENSSGGKRI